MRKIKENAGNPASESRIPDTDRRTPNSRRQAYEALTRIDGGAYPNLAINAELGHLSDAERRFATKLVYTTFENRETLDALLSRFLKRPVKPAVRRVLRMGTCQIMYMDVPHRAAVDESVKLAKELGKKELAPFVNAVLRNVSKYLEEEKDSISSLFPVNDSKIIAPDWLREMWERDYGVEFAAKLIASFGKRPIVVRRNAILIDEKQFLEEANRENLTFTRGQLVPDALKLDPGVKATGELFRRGFVAIQSEASQWICRVVDAKKGMRILDACAAPGGKTCLLAAQIGDEGQIIAWDKHPHRAALIDAACKRLGAKCVKTAVHDATRFLPEYECAFDAVLVDAPCSGLGVYKSGLWENKCPNDITALAAISKNILETCSRYVKPGGALVYSTCTVSRQENEAVADAFSAAHPEFLQDDLGQFLPDMSEMHSGNNIKYYIQLFPAMIATDAFFAARWVRKN